MKKTQMILTATALTLSLAVTAGIADAKPTRHHAMSTAKANAVTADLNRKQLQGSTVTVSGTDANGNSMSNSTGTDINSAAATTDQNSVPAGSMSSTTNSAVAGDSTQASPPPAGQPTTDSTVPATGPTMDQSTTQPKPSEDKGATGKNANPTDAADQPAQ